MYYAEHCNAHRLGSDSLQLRTAEAEDNARMTTEQLNELAEALRVLSEKSSVLKEREELNALMEENRSAEEVRLQALAVSMRIFSYLRIRTHPLLNAFVA